MSTIPRINTIAVCLTLFLAFSLISMPAFSEDSAEQQAEQALDGELLLPDDYNQAQEKKCMTVCEQWGEDCIINPRTGGRKCRRVCKSFAEECF